MWMRPDMKMQPVKHNNELKPGQIDQGSFLFPKRHDAREVWKLHFAFAGIFTSNIQED